MSAFKDRNIHAEFDALVEESLGHHIYVLCDGSTPFYVGKGGGKTGSGNKRLVAHFEEARNIPASSSDKSRKVSKIHEVWKRGDVTWFVLRRQIPDEATAFALECATIDLLKASGFNLTNEQGGHYANHLGMLATPSDVFASAAKPFDLEALKLLGSRPIFLFNVKNAVQANKGKFANEALAYEEATREAWMVGQKLRDLTQQLPNSQKPIALGLSDGIARSAMVVDEWERVNEAKGKGKYKWRIVSKQALEPAIADIVLYRNFRKLTERAKGYWGYGNWIAVEPNAEDGSIQFIRGVKGEAAVLDIS